MINPETVYQQRKATLTAERTALLKKKNRLSWLRLFSVLLTGFIAWQGWSTGVILVLPVLLCGLGVFLFILSKDLNNNSALENNSRLLAINETETGILAHRFTHLPDGLAYLPVLHDYAHDLDIFGRASLFQYVNRAETEQGKQLLANWLLHPASADIILQRQEAVKELSTQTDWRQQLQAYGQTELITAAAEQNIKTWLAQPDQFISNPFWKLLRYLFPLLSLGWLGLHIAGVITASLFYPVVILFLSGSLLISKQIMPLYKQLDKTAPQLNGLSKSAAWVEAGKFSSSLLLTLQQQYIVHQHHSSYTIQKLRKILDMFDIRLNPLVFIPANTFLCWDLQQAFALEKWKREHKENISHWFEALAEMECLSSLGTLAFNNPQWTFARLSNEEAVFDAEELGHPLIAAEKRIASSFTTKGRPQLNLVTGSNMAGKSTFLRSVGVNHVLAMAGAPSCAKQLEVSPVKIMSSMRIADNLEESTSTFYAELKKLKEIIAAVNRKEKVFLLLDEILRGTNSADRHAGSEALIKQLMHHEGAGLIATHDLELAKLSASFPDQVHNYHFDVQVAGTELYFDYQLKAGVCQSMNASLLMKKIGIEL